MKNPDRRMMFDAARRLLTQPGAKPPVEGFVGKLFADDSPPRLTPHILETTRMARSRERILTNLDEMYREAFSRAQATGDQAQMATLDFAYRREQLYFEILLDVRDSMDKVHSVIATRG